MPKSLLYALLSVCVKLYARFPICYRRTHAWPRVVWKIPLLARALGQKAPTARLSARNNNVYFIHGLSAT